MKISDTIKQLQQILAQYGDLHCCVESDDGGYVLLDQLGVDNTKELKQVVILWGN